MHSHTHTLTHAPTNTRMFTRTRAYSRTHWHTLTHGHIHSHTHSHTHSQTHTQLPHTRTHTHAHTHARTRTHRISCARTHRWLAKVLDRHRWSTNKVRVPIKSPSSTGDNSCWWRENRAKRENCHQILRENPVTRKRERVRRSTYKRERK